MLNKESKISKESIGEKRSKINEDESQCLAIREGGGGGKERGGSYINSLYVIFHYV
jgi:hypothetical protein